MRSASPWPAIIVLSALATGVTMYANVHSPVRVVVALWFLSICPGMALVRPLRLRATHVLVTLAIALSLALDAILASAMLYLGLWSPAWALAALIAISLGGVAWDLGLTRRRGRASAASRLSRPTD
jgi:hypothetical protein